MPLSSDIPAPASASREDSESHSCMGDVIQGENRDILLTNLYIFNEFQCQTVILQEYFFKDALDKLVFYSNFY